MSGETCLYENPVLRREGDGLIRPGGLELTRKAVAMCALNPGSKVLDIGCGTGAALRCLSDGCAFRAVGIDLSQVLLAEGRQKDPGLLLVRASGEDLPFADATMDAILAECSLSVMEDVESVLDECARVLKPRGLLIVHDVYARNPDAGERPRRLPVRSCLDGAASRREWLARLEGGGFAVAVWEDHSRALIEFAAKLIFSDDSREIFPRLFAGAPETGQGRAIQCGVSLVKPGYFLAIARKIYTYG